MTQVDRDWLVTLKKSCGEEALRILSGQVCAGFGPALAVGALGQETRRRSEQRDGAPGDGPWQSCGAPSSFRLGGQQEVSRICHELSD
jgi:hypothetical protein